MKAAVLVFAIPGLFLTACGGGSPSNDRDDSRKPATPVRVHTITVGQVQWPITYQAVGTVRARSAAVISAKIMGYVREVRVGVGDRVRSGELIVVLDSRDLEASYQQAVAERSAAENSLPEAESGGAAAKANLELVQVTFRRMQELYNEKSISDQEYDETAAKLKAAQANYEMALSKVKQSKSRIAQNNAAVAAAAINRGYSHIAAPFDGIVTEKTAEAGNLAMPGQPLLTIESQAGYRLEATVDAAKLPAIRLGQNVDVSLEALGRRVPGRVSEIVPSVDPTSRAALVKISLPQQAQPRSGTYGTAMFDSGSRTVIAVPESAISRRGQLASVMTASRGQAVTRIITTGDLRDGDVEVLSGLNPGDRVIAPFMPALTDGTRVEAQ